MSQIASICEAKLRNTRRATRSVFRPFWGLALCGAFAVGVALPAAWAEELRRPEAFTHHDAQLRDIRLHYVREGSGPPLILLHGWPGFWWEWHLNIGPLAKDFDVIVPDMRGYGDSEKPPLDQPKLFGVDHVVDDIDGLMDQLQIKQAYLVGHDWAAIIVHKFVRKYPNRVIQAMVIDPIVPGAEALYFSPEHANEAWYFWFHQLDMAVALVGSSRDATKAYYSHFLSHWSYNKNLWSSEELEIYADNFRKPGNIQGGFNTYRGSAGWTDLDKTVSSVRMTFLSGQGDTVISPKGVSLIPQFYTNYTLETVPDSGHFMMREKPDLMNDRIRKAFLGSQ
jgi:pimeloyl-ACP methyl ester carboxylesterase